MIDTSSSMLYHIGNLNTKNESVTRQMATGKAIDKGSENSLLHSNLINFEDKLRVSEELKDVIIKSQVLNTTSDSSMKEMKNSLDNIKVDLLKGLNSGMQRSDKLALATNLRGIRDNMHDLLNTHIDGEYVFSGSDTTKHTMDKDPDFALNGKIDFKGDGFLRKVPVQPGSYRDRGVTAYDVAFYTSTKARAGESFEFTAGEKVIDENGNEWKMNPAKDKLQKYDHDGLLYDPPVELDLLRTKEPKTRIDLGIDANTDATGNYTININGTDYTGTGSTAQDIRDDLANQIPVGQYTVSALDHNDKFYISSVDGSDLLINVTDDDVKYNMTASNEIEASKDDQSRQATYVIENISKAKVGGTFSENANPLGRIFEAKHNYFNDLNIIINALEGHSTQLDGLKGEKIKDESVRETLANGLEQTTNQFSATNIGHGELGGRNNVFNIAEEKITSQITHFNILLQEYGGADMAKLAMDSKALEMTYQSLFTTISKMHNMSLVNFIK